MDVGDFKGGEAVLGKFNFNRSNHNRIAEIHKD